MSTFKWGSSQLPETLPECHTLIKQLLVPLEKLQQEVHELRALQAKLTADNDALRQSYHKLQVENEALKTRLNLNSSNSSKPPSSDRKKRKKKKGSDKPSGGQPGHQGHHRALRPSEEADAIVDCALTTCVGCGGSSIALTGDCQRHQVYELPAIQLDLTEYRLAKGQCCGCGLNQVAPLPEGVTWGITGPRLTSLMSDMVGEYHLSRRQLKHWLKELFGFELSLGSVFNKQKLVNEALSEPVEALLPWVKQGPCHLDETSHSQAGVRHWLWTVASQTAAYFTITPSRGKKVVSELMGDYDKVAITDRYSVYNYFDSDRRQLCWSHLKRDFQRFAERREPIVRRIGQQLLELEAQVFRRWYEYKTGTLTRLQLQTALVPLRRALGERLEQGRYTAPELRLTRFCSNLLEHFYALWTFAYEEGVEPTNNHAERCLRPSVIWRKKYFGTHFDYGTEYVARMASVTGTCRLQQKSTLRYLTQLMTHQFSGSPAPPLITAS